MGLLDDITSKAQQYAAALRDQIPTVGGLLAPVDNARRVVAKNIGDLLANPSDYLSMVGANTPKTIAEQGAGLGSLGILSKSSLVKGGDHFGQWQLQNVERRLTPQEYIDASGENRTKLVGDWSNPETSYGSGQPIVNVYWLKHNATGEVQPFGEDTAYMAMGKSSTDAAKKQFSSQLSDQRNNFIKDQKESLGLKWFEGGPAMDKVRENLLLEKINEDQAAQQLAAIAAKQGLLGR